MLPIPRVNLVDMLRQRLPVIAPFDTAHAMRKNVGMIRFIPPHYVAVLLCKSPNWDLVIFANEQSCTSRPYPLGSSTV
jgi:hypothetical protein